MPFDWQGETEPDYTDFKDDEKYTWVKAPRFQGKPVQVGPVSNILAGYAREHAPTRKWTDDAFARVSKLAGRKIGIDALQSTMGRYLARAIRSAMLAEMATAHWERLVENVSKGDVATFNPPKFPKESVEGVGVHEAPRGTLSHWVVVKGGVLSNYQAVVPTTWNASPRDEDDTPGPYESSLVGTPVADPEKPLEILRTVHSFDPCMACACHTLDPEGRTIAVLKVL